MDAPKKIAVAGATGRVGHHLVDLLDDGGHQVVPISRSSGVDAITGDGLAEALTRVECVVDAATGPSPEQVAATEFFTTATRNLQAAGVRLGVRRTVVVSIIGADRFRAGYGAAKLAHEQAAVSGPVPARVLRAAQFHEFVGQLLDWGRQGDVSYVPAMRLQPVAARSVAEALAELATESDTGSATELITEIAGPREERLVEAARLLASRQGDPVRVKERVFPDDPDREAFEGGGLLPGRGPTLAGPTFGEWLQSRSLAESAAAT